MKLAKNNTALKEYKDFLQKYLFPLLGIPSENNIEDYAEEPEIRFCNKLVFQKSGYIYFSNNKEILLKLRYVRELSEDNINLSMNIIQSFFKVSKYKIDVPGASPNHDYYSVIQQESNYEMAVQKGICNWIVEQNNDKIEELFGILEKWSVQTYEGKKVTFGFIINPDAKSDFNNEYGTWCDFLKDDFSAVFSDCIHSVIELDSNCNFCRYLSATENDRIEKCDLKYDSALRFSMVMQKFVVGKCVGVFLLNNGDMILAKNGAVKFVKRNLKWLNFSYDAFKNSFGTFIEDNKIRENILQSIFASMLDVSFSHTGGIIALVKDIKPLIKKDVENESVLNPCDYLLGADCDVEAYFNNERIPRKEQDKRMLKRNIVKTFINNQKFTKLDRKLRCELISLDGACILDKQGNVCACGAIIKNDSGSTGGGRGAASKKLSNYGFAIKISTDGYIELYIDGNKKYSIK